jgi:hypothetical protein
MQASWLSGAVCPSGLRSATARRGRLGDGPGRTAPAAAVRFARAAPSGAGFAAELRWAFAPRALPSGLTRRRAQVKARGAHSTDSRASSPHVRGSQRLRAPPGTTLLVKRGRLLSIAGRRRRGAGWAVAARGAKRALGHAASSAAVHRRATASEGPSAARRWRCEMPAFACAGRRLQLGAARAERSDEAAMAYPARAETEAFGDHGGEAPPHPTPSPAAAGGEERHLTPRSASTPRSTGARSPRWRGRRSSCR